VSAEKAKKGHDHKKSWDLTGPWAGAWKAFAGVGVLGLLGAGAGYASDQRRFAYAWMFAFVTVLAVALGNMFFVLVQRLTSAGWSVTVRRTAEFYTYGILVMIPLFIPALLTMNHLWPSFAGEGQHHASMSLVTPAYAQAPAASGGTSSGRARPKDKPAGTVPVGEGTHGEPAGSVGDPTGRLPGAAAGVPADKPAHGDGHGGGHGNGQGEHAGQGAHGSGGNPHALIHHQVMEKKSVYLNKTFFLARMVGYFVIWAILALRLFKLSTDEDKKKDPNLTIAAQRFAPGATVLFGLTLTFAAFDWIMALEPTWFSTIFGVTYFACGVVASYATLILTTLALKKSGPLEGAVTVEHYHDLGKLMFGFLVFWGYVNFSQFMLIWYAALPEETTFYHNRWDWAPWDKVSFAIMALHFVVPFFWTMSRWFKRNTGRLQIGALILVVMHCVNMYWHVMPNYMLGQDGFTFHWMDIACLLAVAGIYGAVVFHRMTKHPLIPVGDPRLERSFHFQNA